MGSKANSLISRAICLLFLVVSALQVSAGEPSQRILIRDYLVGGSDGRVYITIREQHGRLHGTVHYENRLLYYRGPLELEKPLTLKGIRKENLLGWDGTRIHFTEGRALKARC
ncbi:hypothetical protein [Chitinilyticum litopenaei]|uniref:hypothetical protein n=1 Tax=Chitinilyticum litopenaei TaxID=1121276 RepID=UPI0004054047|nr:hypothetical protein [Chitinilyticum litopenaei]